MKTMFLCLFLTLSLPADSLRVLFWNLENYFDWRNDSTSVADAEFSSQGARRWTRKRFYAKTNAIAKAILWASSSSANASGSDNFPESHHLPSVNGMPDIIGLAEVENAFVLRRLLDATALRKLDYRVVHFDSPDPRGIDVALLYRSSRLELLDARPCHLYAADSTVLATRDILLCEFKKKTSGTFAVLVNHHPSKYGGTSESEPRRRIAVERLRFLADSLMAVGIDRIIACGDFNDTPDNPVFRLLEPALLPLHIDLFRRGEGTIKYDGKWDLIDHFYASPAWDAPWSPTVSQDSAGHPSFSPIMEGSPGDPGLSMRILRIPFLLTRDTSHSGERPLRTYLGPRYTGGVSDHLPVLLEIELPP